MTGTLWLVPGHLGEPEDLSLRAVRLLKTSAVLLVEPGSNNALEALVRTLGITIPARRLDVTGGEPVATEVIATLDAGQDAVVFGNEEGIPCFMDPGVDLVRAVRLARPDAPIRSIGGASVLGTALMRMEQVADTFVFLGSIQQATEPHRERLRNTMRWSATHPTTCFAFVNGASAKGLAQGLADTRWPLRVEATLLVDLTKPSERVIATILGPGHATALDDLPDDAVAVLALRGTWAPGATLPRGHWLERWWRGAFNFRI